MSLKLFWTGHGYSATAATSASQTFTLGYDILLLSSATPGNSAGRFTGTRGLGFGTVSQYGAMTKIIPFESDKVVRGAADVKLVTGTTTFPIIAYSNGTVQSSTSNPLTLASTFFGVQRKSAASGGQLELRVNNVVVATGTTTINLNSYYHIEWEADVNVAGSFKLWINNVLDINYSGDITNSLTTTEYRVRFGWNYTHISGFYLWDNAVGGAFTGYVGDFEPIQLLPNGPGVSSEGTPVGAGNNWQCVDETFRNGTTDYVSLSDQQNDFYEYANLATTPNIFTVVAQPAYFSNQIPMRLTIDCYSNGNIQNSNLGPYIGSNGYNWTTYGPVQYTVDFPVDPYTGNAWDANGVNAAQFGITANI